MKCKYNKIELKKKLEKQGIVISPLWAEAMKDPKLMEAMACELIKIR